MLIISPDCYTAWNCRRRLFDPLSFNCELQFVDIILSKHPKSSDTWSYRYYFIEILLS